jgi:hypothetical protein
MCLADVAAKKENVNKPLMQNRGEPATPRFQHLLSVTYRNPAVGTARGRYELPTKGNGMASEFANIDRALNEVLVQLGGMVLTLASPQVTRTGEERQALGRVDTYRIHKMMAARVTTAR